MGAGRGRGRVEGGRRSKEDRKSKMEQRAGQERVKIKYGQVQQQDAWESENFK